MYVSRPPFHPGPLRLCPNVLRLPTWLLLALSALLPVPVLPNNLRHQQHRASLQDVTAVVPKHVIYGQTVHLYCKFTMTEFYTLKWFLNDLEVYRLVPEAPRELQRMTFHQTNLTVDIQGSKMIGPGEHLLVLQRVQRSQSGTYKCQITENAPPFKFFSSSSNLTVMILPEHHPTISGLRTNPYFPGDKLNINCTSSPSYPAAILTWYINSEKAKNFQVTSYLPQEVSSGLEVATLGLSFTLLPEHWTQGGGKLLLTCAASLPPVRDSEIRMDRTVQVPSIPLFLYSQLSSGPRLTCDKTLLLVVLQLIISSVLHNLPHL